ncbi:MAG: MarC family protein [Alphaproteobacteria bacterium]|nr:MarC family protein [Alphaproteobacteria bacterium]
MLETALTALTTFFVTIGPLESAFVFVGLTPAFTRAERRRIALRACLIATIVLLVFLFFGEMLLARLGVSTPALRVAGGIILFMIALDMIFARSSGGLSLTPPETAEAARRSSLHDDIAVFPLATPLLAGPGAMSGAILLAASVPGGPVGLGLLALALLAIMALTLALLLIAQEIHDLIGLTAQKVLVRVFGILLAAIAAQSVFDGLEAALAEAVPAAAGLPASPAAPD